MHIPDDTPLDELEISVRLLGALRRALWHETRPLTFAIARTVSDRQLRQQSNIGAVTVAEWARFKAVSTTPEPEAYSIHETADRRWRVFKGARCVHAGAFESHADAEYYARNLMLADGPLAPPVAYVSPARQRFDAAFDRARREITDLPEGDVQRAMRAILDCLKELTP